MQAGKQHTVEATRRLLSRLTEHPLGCFEFVGTLNHKGYGRISVSNKDMYAHRFMMEVLQGRELAPLEVVMHSCDNPKCCNPNHLKLGTVQDNTQDMIQKGRRPVARKRNRLTVPQVKRIKLMLCYTSVYGVANALGISDSTVRHIANGHTWKHVTLPAKPDFEYDPFADY